MAAPDSTACPFEEDVRMWRSFVALLPYTVHVDYEAEWMELARRDAQQRAAALARIPAQRTSTDPGLRLLAGQLRGRRA